MKRLSLLWALLVFVSTLLTGGSIAMLSAAQLSATDLTCHDMNCEADDQICTDGEIEPGCWANHCNGQPDMICQFVSN